MSLLQSASSIPSFASCLAASNEWMFCLASDSFLRTSISDSFREEQMPSARIDGDIPEKFIKSLIVGWFAQIQMSIRPP